MKKILATAAIASAFISCQVGSAEVEITSADDVIAYSSHQLHKSITAPAVVMGSIIDLDAYLKLTDEEKIDKGKLDYDLAYLGENTYRIHDINRDFKCVVNTQGKSILDEGTEWIFASIESQGADSHCRSSYYEVLTYPEGTVVQNVDAEDKIWEFIVTDQMKTSFMMMPSDSLYCWLTETRCVDVAENGLASISDTGEEGMVVREWKDTYSNTKKFSLNGSFTTEIYRDDKKIDFCTCQFRPGFSAGYTTSR